MSTPSCTATIPQEEKRRGKGGGEGKEYEHGKGGRESWQSYVRQKNEESKTIHNVGAKW